MSEQSEIPNASRKLFFGLFVFPLVIAVGMAVMLCTVVLLTHEKDTPESLIGAIKKSSPAHRWQKAFELSNELNRVSSSLRQDAVMKEIIQLLQDSENYDAKTRSFMALALSHFHDRRAVEALQKSLKDPHEDVRLYALWSLGALGAKEAVPDILPYIHSEAPDTRKTAVYVLGAIGETSVRDELRPLLSDPVSDVRWNTALALARLRDASGLDILIKMMRRTELSNEYRLSEPQIESVMSNAAKGLALIRTPEAIKILTSVSRSDSNLKVRQAALNALHPPTGKINS